MNRAVPRPQGLVDGQAGNALIGFPLVFFAVWWAWVNFAWFGSAYDNDDVLYRLRSTIARRRPDRSARSFRQPRPPSSLPPV
jgi:Bacterial low temperature requirement A protein (LtrA)